MFVAFATSLNRYDKYDRAELSEYSEVKQERSIDCSYLRESVESRINPRPRTVDDGESREEEVESDSSDGPPFHILHLSEVLLCP